MSEAVPSSDRIPPEIRFLGKLLGASILYAQTAQDPKRACDIAEELVAVLEHKTELGEWARANIRIEKSWADGVKYLTGESRLVRAQTKFVNWLKRTRLVGLTNSVNHPNLHSFIRLERGLRDWQEHGFTGEELQTLRGKTDRPEKFSLKAAKASNFSRATKKKNKADQGLGF